MRRDGFTLIEVLVVMIIMAILVGTAVLSLGAGLKSARMRDAARTVEQYIRHAKAVALLKQRPVVITFEEIAEDGVFARSRVSLDFSGDASQAQTLTPLGQGFMTGGGQVQTLSGRTKDGEIAAVVEPLPEENEAKTLSSSASAVAAGAGMAADDPLAAPPREFEGIHVRGELQEDRTEGRARISVFSNVDFLLKQSAARKQAKESAASSGQDDEDLAARADAEREKKEKDEEQDKDTSFSVVYEANGRCDPFVVRVWKEGDDEQDATEIFVGRFGRVVPGGEVVGRKRRGGR